MDQMDKLVSLCKRRGFIFQSSEIYGGIASCWDYGPLGVELKRNVKNLWWKDNILDRDDMVGIDASIIMSPKVWKASGHVDGFSDPFRTCPACSKHYRADQVGDKCPQCDGQLGAPTTASLMLETFFGAVRETAERLFLRPETAQGIFVNFTNVLATTRKKLPFGIGQIGKAFRNEITPGNFIFRTREFEQMEIEFFVKAGADEEWHQKWVNDRLAWYIKYGVRKENLRLRTHEKDELAHYAKACYDIEYNFPMGWSELEGIANRTDFDLKRHTQHSGQALTYFDEETKEHIIPYVIEPSAGVDRSALAFLLEAYHEEQVKGEKRVVLRFHSAVAPVKAAVLPLLRNRPEIVKTARALAASLRRRWHVMYDDTGSIGKLYRRQDEIGTPFCITVDVQSLEDKAITVRDRDSMEQVRLPITEVEKHLSAKLA
jgi:glycyl-tRNA synthetase